MARRRGLCEICNRRGVVLARWIYPPICDDCHDREELTIEAYVRIGSARDLICEGDHDVGRLGTNSDFCRALTKKMVELGIFVDKPKNPNDYIWMTEGAMIHARKKKKNMSGDE